MKLNQHIPRRLHQTFGRARWKRLLLATAVIGTIWLLVRFRRPLLHLLRLLGDREAVITYLDSFGVAAPILLGTLIVLQIIIAALPGHALLFASGYLYGFPLGLCLNLLTVVGGSQIAFLLAHRAGRPLVKRLTPVETLDRLHAMAQQKGLIFFMFAFLLPIFPADVLNYAAGLSGLAPRRFFVASLLGRLPVVAISTAVGAYAYQFSTCTFLGIGGIAVLLFLLWRQLVTHVNRNGYDLTQSSRSV